MCRTKRKFLWDIGCALRRGRDIPNLDRAVSAHAGPILGGRFAALLLLGSAHMFAIGRPRKQRRKQTGGCIWQIFRKSCTKEKFGKAQSRRIRQS